MNDAPITPDVEKVSRETKLTIVKAAIAIGTLVFSVGGAVFTYAWQSNERLVTVEVEVRAQSQLAQTKLDYLVAGFDNYRQWAIEETKRSNERLNRMDQRQERTNDLLEQLRAQRKVEADPRTERYLPPFRFHVDPHKAEIFRARP